MYDDKLIRWQPEFTANKMTIKDLKFQSKEEEEEEMMIMMIMMMTTTLGPRKTNDDINRRRIKVA